MFWNRDFEVKYNFMDNEFRTLDQGLVDQAISNVDRLTASSGKRLANYIIDGIIVYILNIGTSVVYLGIVFETVGDPVSQAIGNFFVSIATAVLYYTALEASTGKTIGKYVTNTRVVSEDGAPLTTGNVLIRSLCRYIPFEQFSFLGSRTIGWHDSISKTRVIDENLLARQRY